MCAEDLSEQVAEGEAASTADVCSSLAATGVEARKSLARVGHGDDLSRLPEASSQVLHLRCYHNEKPCPFCLVSR